MPFKYLIVYEDRLRCDKIPGPRNVCITREKKLNTEAEIDDVKKDIANMNEKLFKSPTLISIINIIPLEG